MRKKRKTQVNNCYSHEIYSTGEVATLVRNIQEELKPREILDLLKLPSLRFAFLEIDQKMYWVEEDTQTFWELEVKPNLCKPITPKIIKKLAKGKFQIPDYCYYASLWEAENLDKIIVLFMAH